MKEIKYAPPPAGEQPVETQYNIEQLTQLGSIHNSKISELSSAVSQLQVEFNRRLNSICKAIQVISDYIEPNKGTS